MRRYLQGLILTGLVLVLSGCTSKFENASWDYDIHTIKSEFKNATNKEKRSALNRAIFKPYSNEPGNYKITKYLIENGVKVKNEHLLLAVMGDNLKIVKYLVEEHKLDVNYLDRWGVVPLLGALERENHRSSPSKNDDKIIQYLVSNGARCDLMKDDNKKARFKRLYNRAKSICDKYEVKYKHDLLIRKQEAIKQKAIKQANLKKAKDEQRVNQYVLNNDFQGLKNFTDKNPNAVYYIKNNDLRLMLTGPKGLKVGDIIRYVKDGKSDLIITSLINRADTPYKQFNMNEIETLQKLGLSDKIIASMINRTTKLLDDEKLKKQQDFLLTEQQRIANQKTKIVYRDNPNQKVDSQGNPIVEAVQDELIKQGAKMLFDKLF